MKLKKKDVFNLGKHKGKVLKSVILSDPGYIYWGIDNGVFEITDSAWDLLDDQDYKQPKQCYKGKEFEFLRDGDSDHEELDAWGSISNPFFK